MKWFVVTVIVIVIFVGGYILLKVYSEDSVENVVESSSVKIVDFSFDAETIKVNLGDTVTFTNNGAATHTVTAKDGSFDSGNIETGERYFQEYSEAGTFEYNCTIHPNMEGKVIVE